MQNNPWQQPLTLLVWSLSLYKTTLVLWKIYSTQPDVCIFLIKTPFTRRDSLLQKMGMKEEPGFIQVSQLSSE